MRIGAHLRVGGGYDAAVEYAQRLGYDALQIGLAFLPVTVSMGLLSIRYSERLVTRFGARALLVPGLALIGAGLIVFSQSPVHASYLLNVMPAMTLLGIGGGICFPALMNVGMAGVEPEDAGLASGLLNTGAQAGGALGLAMLATLAGSRSSDLIKHGRTTTAALTSGYHLAFWIAAGLVALAIPTVLATRPARAGAEAIALDPRAAVPYV